ncbi:hypothetical protein BB559_004127 [Furculomyces boomerangus]|uniref:BZIP domain-containing protein n=1 Tax=Furculomyces boomerangus TaxID=61424 RepID=A0A2T9YGL7_9FUNG|nr:hypothetical protein BB559_004127 [Furculomyces boomerangus]
MISRFNRPPSTMQKKNENPKLQSVSTAAFTCPMTDLSTIEFQAQFDNYSEPHPTNIWDQPLVLGDDSGSIPVSLGQQNSKEEPYMFNMFPMVNDLNGNSSSGYKKASGNLETPQLIHTTYSQAFNGQLNLENTTNRNNFNNNQNPYNGNMFYNQPNRNLTNIQFNDSNTVIPQSSSNNNRRVVNSIDNSAQCPPLDPVCPDLSYQSNMDNMSCFDTGVGSKMNIHSSQLHDDEDHDSISLSVGAQNLSPINEDSNESISQKRIARRRERNREAARRSRERRTVFVSNLRKLCEGLERENVMLKVRINALERELQIIKSNNSSNGSTVNLRMDNKGQNSSGSMNNNMEPQHHNGPPQHQMMNHPHNQAPHQQYYVPFTVPQTNSNRLHNGKNANQEPLHSTAGFRST